MVKRERNIQFVWICWWWKHPSHVPGHFHLHQSERRVWPNFFDHAESPYSRRLKLKQRKHKSIEIQNIKHRNVYIGSLDIEQISNKSSEQFVQYLNTNHDTNHRLQKFEHVHTSAIFRHLLLTTLDKQFRLCWPATIHSIWWAKCD